MICPSCGYDNIEGADRCEECMRPLFNIGAQDDQATTGLARSVMEDDLNKLDHEFLAVSPQAAANEVIDQMKQSRLGCALVLDQGKLVGIFTERDLLNKLTGNAALPGTTRIDQLMSANPEVLRDTDSVAAALNKMSLGRYRHIPVQKSDGTYCVTSIKHVLKYLARSKW
ncbi:MAG TPA: CBS domain-containing protein [Pyrinomonadaceae bacterium]|jgi:signal-transduction protein with cAMP-binding, CBS, and nucleotidyltransferase domain|nr:CBS domain-containing protein [Pyrinomonadaceae bacterium]